MALSVLALGLTLHVPGPLYAAEKQDKTQLIVPEPDIGIMSLKRRQEAQLLAARDYPVFHEFSFADRRPESGITFRNLITDDNLKQLKPTHYDHGNGVAVADVDGDGLHDIYFVTQIGSNELWRNRGEGRFENITEQAGVGLADRISVAGSFGDFDNDGDPDLFATTVKMGNVLFENDGKGRFRDISEQAGVAYSGHSSGAFFFDYNNDGLLDLFVTNIGTYTSNRRGSEGYYIGFYDAFSGHLFPQRNETSLLYENLGDKRFREVSKEVGLVDDGWSGDATFVDLDGDRYPEVYVLNMQGDDHYYENHATEEGRRFVDKTESFFPRTSWGAMGVKFFDYNNDGQQDLFVTDMHSDMSQPAYPNEEKSKSVMVWSDEHLQGGANNLFGNSFYENKGDGEFAEVSDLLGVENYWPWGISVGDLNADGYEDVFVASSMSFPFRYGINSVLLNSEGTRFLDSEFVLGVEPRREGLTRIPWFNLDCSGQDRSHPRCKDREGQFTLMGTVGTRASVAFDLDGDGDLDVVTNDFYYFPQILISDLAERKDIRFLKVKLIGTRSNRDGLGAHVKVVAGSQVYTRYHDGKWGYLTQSSLPMYFGLGDADWVDRIEVTWPSGVDQTVTKNIKLDSIIEIEER